MGTIRQQGAATRAPEPRDRATVQPAGASALLALQRSAGNAAVAAMVQRCGPRPCDCSSEEKQEFATSEEAEPRVQRASTPALVLRQVAVPAGGGTNGHDPCLDLLQAIIDLLDEVAKRFRDAQDDPHDLFKFHRHLNEAHPDHGSWDGHRDKFHEKRDELRRKVAEWDANDDCGEFRLSRQQQEDLIEAREFSGKEYPAKPARTLREAEESEQESIWDKLRRPLPGWVVNTLIALGAFALAVVLVVAFATGAGEIAVAVAGVGLVLGLAIKAAMRAAGVRDTSEEA